MKEVPNLLSRRKSSNSDSVHVPTPPIYNSRTQHSHLTMGDASLNCFVLCWIRLDAILSSSIIQSKSFQLLMLCSSNKESCLLWRCRSQTISPTYYFPPPFSISFRSETHNTSPIAKKVLIPLQTTSEIGDVLHFGSAIRSWRKSQLCLTLHLACTPTTL